jgi:hypothetical protein
VVFPHHHPLCEEASAGLERDVHEYKCLALGAGGPGAATERIERFGLFGEHRVAEDAGDGFEVLPDDGEVARGRWVRRPGTA